MAERHLVTSRRSAGSAPSTPEPEATACPGRNLLRGGRDTESEEEKMRARGREPPVGGVACGLRPHDFEPGRRPGVLACQ